MSSTSVSSPFPLFGNADGQPLDAGFIYVGIENLEPISNPVSIYWDYALTIPASQPVRTLGGYPSRGGTPSRFYTDSNYSITVKDKKSRFVFSSPSVSNDANKLLSDLANTSDIAKGDALVGVKQPVTDSSPRTQHDKNNDVKSTKDFGVTEDGVTDDGVAFQKALNWLGANGGKLTGCGGTIFIGSDLGASATLNVSNFKTAIFDACGTTITTSGAIYALKITGGSFPNIIPIRNLKIDHAGNTTANGGIYVYQAGFVYTEDCVVVANNVKSGYAAFKWENGPAGDGGYWNRLVRCTVRKNASADPGTIPYGLLVIGGYNSSSVESCSFSMCNTGIEITRSGDYYLPNGFMVWNTAFEICPVGVHVDALGGSASIIGFRGIGCRFEIVGRCWTLEGTDVSSSIPPVFSSNVYIPSSQYPNMVPVDNFKASGAVTAGAFEVGRRYKIASVGTTDFSLIGALADPSIVGSPNAVGVTFIATGAGTGTGTAYSNDRVSVQVDDRSLTPELNAEYVSQDSMILKSTKGTAHALDLQAGGDDRGIVLRNSAGAQIGWVTINGETVAADVAATALVAGRWYRVVTAGTTTWTSWGAYGNSIGTIFKAISAGTGTGTATPITMPKAFNFKPVFSGYDTVLQARFSNLRLRTSAGGVENVAIEDTNGVSDYLHAHLMMGVYHLWVDATGKLRIKAGAPTTDLDGTVVGTQT